MKKPYDCQITKVICVCINYHGLVYPRGGHTPLLGYIPFDVDSLYSSPPLSTGNMFQHPQWTPETMDSSKPYTYYVFPTYMHTYDQV